MVFGKAYDFFNYRSSLTLGSISLNPVEYGILAGKMADLLVPVVSLLYRYKIIYNSFKWPYRFELVLAPPGNNSISFSKPVPFAGRELM